MSDRKINVLVAEDSPVTRMFLVHLLESDPQIRVIGAVGDGQAAVDFVNEKKPDVVLMDIHMPRMDGFEATRHIMKTHAVPIVVCSAVSNTLDTVITFKAMEAGAIACIEKPTGSGHANFEATRANLLQTVKSMSEVKVVRRWAASRPAPAARPAVWQRPPAEIKLIGIGASTGGPPVLHTILAGLPQDFAVPVLIVQHIADGFVAGMAEWLNEPKGLRIHVAAHGIIPLPGHVYLAPDDLHMGIASAGHIVLSRQPPENHLRPAVSFLFRSLAKVCGANALGVLLTGMGSDGAEELKALRDAGAVTIAQDRETSVVHGMPGAAIALGGATHVLPANRIAAALIELVDHRNGLSRS